LAALVLLTLVALPAWAGDRKSRIFNSQYDAVWAAADEVSRQAFLQDQSLPEQGRLRFRAGPLRGYRFHVEVLRTGPAQTRVEIELRTNLRVVQKDAWRNGQRYLDLIGQRLAGARAR
jgi:hypothetical protein